MDASVGEATPSLADADNGDGGTMIKALGKAANDTPIVFLGLSGENVTRLTAGEPILIQMADLGLPPMQVALMYGKTERLITAQLEQLGLLPPGTASDMPEPKPSR